MLTTAMRTVRLEDAAAIARVRVAIRGEGQAFLSDVTDVDECIDAEHERLVRTMAESGCVTLVIETAAGTDAAIAAWASFEPRPQRKARHWGMLEIGVLAPWRGQGLGGQLLAELLRTVATNAEIECVRLDCASSNEAGIRFFARCGFVEEGRLVRGIRMGCGGYADIVKMRCHVRSV